MKNAKTDSQKKAKYQELIENINELGRAKLNRKKDRRKYLEAIAGINKVRYQIHKYHYYNLLSSYTASDEATQQNTVQENPKEMQAFYNFLYSAILKNYEENNEVGDTREKLIILSNNLVEYYQANPDITNKELLKSVYRTQLGLAEKYIANLPSDTQEIDLANLALVFKTFFQASFELYKLSLQTTSSSISETLEIQVSHDYLSIKDKTKQLFYTLFDLVAPRDATKALLSEEQFNAIISDMPPQFRQFITDRMAFVDRHHSFNPLQNLNKENGVPVFTIKGLVEVGGDNVHEHPRRVAEISTELYAKCHLVTNETLPSEVTNIHNPLNINYYERRAHLAKLFGAAIPVDDFRETNIDPNILRAAVASVNAACQACDHVLHTEQKTAICITRPPGHHASYDAAAGFCLFNNVFIAAEHARAEGRPAIMIDFDVHHGDGTFDLFCRHIPHDAKDAYFINFYNPDIWPHPNITTSHPNAINIPLPPGTKGETLNAKLQAALQELKNGGLQDPLVLFSAGFDGCEQETIVGNLGWNLQPSDYESFMKSTSDIFPTAPMLSILEGGYVGAVVNESMQYVVKASNDHQHRAKNAVANLPQASLSSSTQSITQSFFQPAASNHGVFAEAKSSVIGHRAPRSGVSTKKE